MDTIELVKVLRRDEDGREVEALGASPRVSIRRTGWGRRATRLEPAEPATYALTVSRCDVVRYVDGEPVETLSDEDVTEHWDAEDVAEAAGPVLEEAAWEWGDECVEIEGVVCV